MGVSYTSQLNQQAIKQLIKQLLPKETREISLGQGHVCKNCGHYKIVELKVKSIREK